MSTIAQQAREEADRVEAEELDGEDGAAAEPAEGESEPAAEPEPELEPQPGVEAFVPDAKALERELKRHDSAMGKVLGPAWEEMETCGTCGGMAKVPADFVAVPEMAEDPDVLVCEACHGYGQRTTPSLNPSYVAAPCTVCNSLGYRTRTEVDAELEHKRIMAEQRALEERLEAQYPTPAPGSNATGIYPPQPPSPVWNQALGRWEFPTDDAGAGLGVASPHP